MQYLLLHASHRKCIGGTLSIREMVVDVIAREGAAGELRQRMILEGYEYTEEYIYSVLSGNEEITAEFLQAICIALDLDHEEIGELGRAYVMRASASKPPIDLTIGVLTIMPCLAVACSSLL